MNTLAAKMTGARSKIIAAILTVAASVALPQLFHALGIISGIGGSAMGTIFLPMHIPVIAAGLIAGPAVGAVAGLASPVLSFALSGMPVAAMLPFMTVELAAYGLIAGMLAKTSLPVVVKVLITQICGRLVRGAAILTAVYALGSTTVTVASIYTVVQSGIIGIILQLIFIPLAFYRLRDTLLFRS